MYSFPSPIVLACAYVSNEPNTLPSISVIEIIGLRSKGMLPGIKALQKHRSDDGHCLPEDFFLVPFHLTFCGFVCHSFYSEDKSQR